MIARAARRRAEDLAESQVARRRRRKLMRISTSVICVAAILLAMAAQEITDVDSIFAETAKIFGGALILALVVEGSGGIRNLLRTDIVMLIALYGLVFVEFLFPQESFTGHVSLQGAQTGTTAALIGFAGIALGRHMALRFGSRPSRKVMRELSNRGLINLFILVAALGYLHILLAVNFDIFEAIRQMALPRFNQSWGRGRLGGVSTLLHEVGLLIFLIPPLAGVVFAQFRQHGPAALFVVASVFALTLFKGFAGGTRNVFLIYIITFSIAYFLTRSRVTIRNLLMLAVPIMAAAAIGSFYMLEFRQTGLSRYDFNDVKQTTIFVDLNLINISQLSEVFPVPNNYLGWEIPFTILIKPIPRAIWPGKPEGLSIGIEEALNATGLTLSATFVGEIYMAGGLLAVSAAALVLGSIGATWNRLGQSLDSRFKLLLYASGFFAAALAMRSILQVAPAILPTLALWFYGHYFLTVKGSSRRSPPPP
jgi:oligosaccharide repeat unit polymerase